MKCEKLRQEFMDAVLGGPETVSAEMQEHLQSCAACAEELVALQQTMTLLEEWPAPEPSPYFNTRLRARMRDEVAAPARSWLAWFRRPVSWQRPLRCSSPWGLACWRSVTLAVTATPSPITATWSA